MPKINEYLEIRKHKIPLSLLLNEKTKIERKNKYKQLLGEDLYSLEYVKTIELEAFQHLKWIYLEESTGSTFFCGKLVPHEVLKHKIEKLGNSRRKWRIFINHHLKEYEMPELKQVSIEQSRTESNETKNVNLFPYQYLNKIKSFSSKPNIVEFDPNQVTHNGIIQVIGKIDEKPKEEKNMIIEDDISSVKSMSEVPYQNFFMD